MKRLFFLFIAGMLLTGCNDRPPMTNSTSTMGAVEQPSETVQTSHQATSVQTETTEVVSENADQTAMIQEVEENTRLNARDKEGATLTPLDQSENEADRTITQKIRQSIVDDSTLSMQADNIKIITINGNVTLRGIVQNPQEKQNLELIAKSIEGVEKVDNQLDVKI